MADEPQPPKAIRGFEAARVIGVVAVGCLFELAIAGRYGYHRDELYFLASGRHLAWGFVDQPPLTPAIARLSESLLPGSLVGLRVWPALMYAAIVITTALIARELGAGKLGQIGASICAAASPGLLEAGHLLSTATFDALAWGVVSLLVIRLIRSGDARWWIVIGMAVGIGLENKWSLIFLVAGLLVGLLLTPQRRLLWSPWFAGGLVLAMAIWAPNLAWQASHSWPQITLIRSIGSGSSGIGPTLTWLPFQFLITGPIGAAVWVAGLLRLLRDQEARPFRAFAFAYLGLAVMLAIAAGDKQYYVAGLYPALWGAGAVPLERWLARAEGHVRRWLFPLTLGAATLVMLPAAVPILPASALHGVPLQKINYDLGEQIGWPDYVKDVAQVWRSLPPESHSHAIILTNNYGEAGAIERYGAALGLPAPYCDHNSFWLWATPPAATDTSIVVGDVSRADLLRFFGSVELAGRLHNADGVDNEEEGLPIWIARSPVAPLPQLWPSLRHYD